MKKSELKKAVESIVNDTTKSVDDRLEEALGLSDEYNSELDDEETAEFDIIIYNAVIDMLWKECNDHSRDLTILQLYTLLAETYDDIDDYRPMNEVARGVLQLMHDDMTPVEYYKETIPRIASAIGNSVYNHALYEILLRYVNIVLEESPEDDSIKPLAKKLLKLNILLDYEEWRERMWDKELITSISKLFTPEELVRIIVNPKIGHLRKDPIEYSYRWEEIYYDLEKELNERFANAPRQRGLCYHIWSAKRELLKDKYGIVWRSPAQMNSRVRFD